MRSVSIPGPYNGTGNIDSPRNLRRNMHYREVAQNESLQNSQYTTLPTRRKDCRIGSHPMERDVPNLKLDDYEYVTHSTCVTGGFGDEVTQGYGSMDLFPRTTPVSGQDSRSAKVERYLREIAGANVNNRQINREFSTRGIAPSITRYIAEDDDIGNLYRITCDTHRPAPANHKQLMDGIERLGLTDLPKLCLGKSGIHPRALEIGFDHHQNDSVALDEIRYLPSCG